MNILQPSKKLQKKKKKETKSIRQNNTKNQRAVGLVVKEYLVGIPLLGFNSHWKELFTFLRFLAKR